MRDDQAADDVRARVIRSVRDGGDLSGLIAELRRRPLPRGVRAQIAADAVEAVVSAAGLGEPRRWPEIEALVELADGVDRPHGSWARTRTVAAATALMGRLVDGRSVDADDVAARLDALARDAPDDPATASYLTATRSMMTVLRSFRPGEGGAAEAHELLARLSAVVPGAEPLLRGAADEMRTVLSVIGDGSRATDEQLRGLVAAAEGGSGGIGVAMRHAAVAAAAMGGGREPDPARIDLAVEHAAAAVALTDPSDAERVQHLVGLAVALMRRFEIAANTTDARAARDRLEEARELAGGPHHPHWSMVNEMLSEIRRLLGGADAAYRPALEGLRGHVWRALAQDQPDGLRAAVSEAGADAVGVARACLVAGDARGAVTALDLGRGLALFAATATGTISGLLENVGRDDLARRWRDAAATGELPSSLRREVLAAVTATDGGAALLDPPTPEDIGRALRAVDADALAYLVPGDGSLTGYAVVVSAAGRAGYIGLPNLATAHHPEVDDYLRAAARRAADGGGDGDDADDFARVLDPLSEWAWGAAMRPLVESYLPGLPEPPSGRPHRVVLVPMGDLARVPWQAAKDGSGRYVIERIAISQATSARLLCRTAELPPVAAATGGLIVGDPDIGPDANEPDLIAARREAYGIREAFYRGARYLGRRPNGPSPSGAGTSAEVVGWLTSDDPADGTVAHLACHGFVDATGPEPAAYLALAGGDRLHARDIVSLRARRPGRGIGLVILSGCRTGGSVYGHDEAYSLGTALLAAGVRTTLCTQWRTRDGPLSAFLFMIHHVMHTEHLPPWAALRRAQLWALDPDRPIPETMPAPLHHSARSAALEQVVVWAALVHWGQ